MPLTEAGRDLDNYLLPIARRFGPRRAAAMFGRKTRGASWLAVGSARPEPAVASLQFSTGWQGPLSGRHGKRNSLTGSCRRRCPPVRSGLAAMELSLMAGPGRHWANLWKPLIDAFGSVLGEVLLRAVQPNHDRIVRLGLQHHVTRGIGHDVTIDAADDAVRHALAAGDPAWSARLVERHVETPLGRSEGATLRRWLSALPAESVRDRPRRSSTTSRSSATSPGR